MASKKFSRLSIMLEARDRMSRPLQQAARASQNLQSRVTQLSGSLNRSRNSISQASVANRILAERYRDLGRRIAGADEQVKLSVKLFRALPAPIRLAAYMIEGYSKALVNLITKNALARITTKILTTTFRALRAAVSNVTWDLQRAVRALWNFSKLGKVVSFLTKPFRLLGKAVKDLNLAMMRSIKGTFAYQLISNVVKTVWKDIKLAAVAQKTFLKDIPHLIKGTRAWQLYNYQVNKVKASIAGVRLAFELWKNSSNAAKKISNVMEDIGWHAKQLWSTIKKNVEGMKQLNNATTNTGTRGRATFNALADANSRLNRELARMNAQLAKSESKLGKMKSSLSSLNAIGLAFSAAYASQAAYNAGQGIVKGTVGKAMEQNYSSASVGILAGAENGAKYYQQIQKYAASTAFSTEDWARNMRGAISKSKNVKELEKYQMAMEQLATLDPVQGLDGAALAIRELNSGDIVSLVERFELPRKKLKEIKNIADPIKQIEALMKIVGKETGYTVENIAKMKELPLMQWQKMTNSIKTAFGYIGSGALEKISPLMEKFNKMWDEGKFKPLITTLTNGFTNMTTGLVNFVGKLAAMDMEGIKAKFQPFITLWGNIKNTLAEAWPQISSIFGDFQTAASGIATVINDNWPTINTVIQDVVDTLAAITDWAVNNWPTIAATLAGVGTAFAVFKTLTWINTAITLFRNGQLLAAAATWIMNTSLWAMAAALWANPIVLIIAAIIGLGVALYVAYQKSETFRNAVQTVFNWIKGVGVQAAELGASAIQGFSDALKSAGDWAANLYTKFSKFTDKVLGFKMPSFKMPSWLGGDKAGTGHHGGLNRVPYNGYQARLHKGERVLTQSEAKNLDSNSAGVTVTGNTFVVRQDSDIDAIANALFSKLSAAKTAMG